MQELVEGSHSQQEISGADLNQRSLVGLIRQLEPGRILALGLVAALLMGFFVYIITRASAPQFTILFGGVPVDDALEITQRLDSENVPYRLNEGGDAILVPADEVRRLRMEFAGQGLPTGGTVGYELFDENSSITATDFVSNVNLKRALEGELARTISSLKQVRSARVHIVTPRRQLFNREAERPKASVVVGASSLQSKQIAGIQHLVSSAVPGMLAEDVSVLDDRGNLLAQPQNGDDLGLAAHHEDQRIAIENRLRNKIIGLLERTVGRNRVDAQVTAEINYDVVSTTTERFDPEGQVARSIQTVEEATDLQENEQDQAVTVQNNLPAEEAANAGTSSRENSNRTEESTNFEISRTVQSTNKVGGRIERLSIAVQVDEIAGLDDNGNPISTPRAAEDLEQLEALVRSAVGFDEERGDWIEVISRPFAPVDMEPPSEPSILDFSREDIWRLAELSLLVVLGLAGLLFGVKPLVNYGLGSINAKVEEEEKKFDEQLVIASDGKPMPLLADGTDEEIGEMEEESTNKDSETDTDIDALVNVSGVEGKVRAALVNRVSDVIENNPDAAVRILRSWLHGG